MLLLVLAVHLAIAQPNEAMATLCIEGECAARQAADRSVTRAEVGRPFVWISPNQSELVAGTIAPGAETFRVDQKQDKHRFVVRFSGARSPVTFQLSDGPSSWTWTTQVPRGPITLTHPSGKILTTRAAGHRTVERKISPAEADLGHIDLQRFPVLSGSVIDAKTSVPVPSAEILSREGALLAKTDQDGLFRAVIEDAWPASVTVSSASHAPRIVPVPKTATDVDLPRIELTDGGTIHLIVQGIILTEAARWQLRGVVTESTDELRREGSFPAGTHETNIDGIDPGRYRILIKGDGGLRQFAIPVTVQAGQVSEVNATIAPVSVEIETRLGDDILESANIEIIHQSAQWMGRLTSDEKGKVASEVWQPGELEAIMSRPPRVMAWRESQEIGEEKDLLQWIIRAADRRIRGRVLDAETGQPVKRAAVFLEMRGPDAENSLVRGTTSETGEFEFGGVIPGGHILEAGKPGYKSDQRWAIGILESDTLREKDLLLEPYAAMRKLLALSANGLPIAGAAVLFATRSGLREIGATDQAGRADVPLTSEDETGTLFVIPRSGSLGYSRMAPTEDRGDEILIRVPDGSASVELRTETTAGDPVSRVAILFRWNGLLFPANVLAKLNQLQGVPFTSDARGRIVYPYLPPGHYDFWAIGGQEEFRRLYSGNPPPPSATVDIVPGPQSVVLKFRATEP